VAELTSRAIRRSAVLAAVVAAGAFASGAAAADDILRLPIGDPARRTREVPLVLDAVTDSASGAAGTPADLPKKLEDVRLLLVGEGHTEMESHRVEKRVLEDLDAAGRRVLVGLEMYPYPEQRWLDDWSAGRLSEDAFLEGSHWYRNWGYNWLYYRDIFLFARDRHLPMFAVNAPRDVIASVRKKGFRGLRPEQAAHIPEQIDTKSAEHLRLFKANFEDESFHAAMTEEGWQAMLNAQCAWDATMGWNAVRSLVGDTDPKTIMVLLVGAGHVQYGLGIERQARQWYTGKIASIIPVEVEDEKKGPVRALQASYANFVWGIPPEIGPLYPDLGIATRTREGDGLLEILDVEKETPAARAGLAAKDVLIAVDGTAIGDRETLSRLMAAKRWGDTATVRVRRGAESVSVTVFLRREMPEKPTPSAEP
jgi:uncharacterized iron-regulated protein